MFLKYKIITYKNKKCFPRFLSGIFKIKRKNKASCNFGTNPTYWCVGVLNKPTICGLCRSVRRFEPNWTNNPLVQIRLGPIQADQINVNSNQFADRSFFLSFFFLQITIHYNIFSYKLIYYPNSIFSPISLLQTPNNL